MINLLNIIIPIAVYTIVTVTTVYLTTNNRIKLPEILILLTMNNKHLKEAFCFWVTSTCTRDGIIIHIYCSSVVCLIGCEYIAVLVSSET